MGGLPELRRLHHVRREGRGRRRYLAKGAKVAIEGKLRYSSWERDGQRRSKLEVIVEDIEFMSRQAGQAAQAPEPADAFDEDIPF